ncbi:MAG: hypothetical protein ACHQZS_09980, partial [Candidatus Binatales bacterium]
MPASASPAVQPDGQQMNRWRAILKNWDIGLLIFPIILLMARPLLQRMNPSAFIDNFADIATMASLLIFLARTRLDQERNNRELRSALTEVLPNLKDWVYPLSLLARVSRQIGLQSEVHVSAANEVQSRIAYQLIEEGIESIHEYLRDPEKSNISVKHVSPTYSLMRQMVDSLSPGSIYAATSKLTSYSAVDDEDFIRFAQRLRER